MVVHKEVADYAEPNLNQGYRSYLIYIQISMKLNSCLKSHLSGYGRQNETEDITSDAEGEEAALILWDEMWQSPCLKFSII